MADRVHSDFSEDDLECSSSSFEEDSGESSLDEEEDRLELRFQRPDVRPYQFEPARNVENGDVDDGSDNSDLDPEMRDNWCTCGNCQEMATPRECKCCRETRSVVLKMEEYEEEVAQPLQCITEHPGFRSVCLDRYVLETAYYQYRQQYGERHGDGENKSMAPDSERTESPMSIWLRQKRYTAYRQLVRWCWGYLGKEVRVVLPSCAVVKIRETFPSQDYSGFHFAG